MPRCEDYPCCGHGPASTGGDGGGCPDERGRFRCVLCGHRMRSGATSAICSGCHKRAAKRAARGEEPFPDSDGDRGDYEAGGY